MDETLVHAYGVVAVKEPFGSFRRVSPVPACGSMRVEGPWRRS